MHIYILKYIIICEESNKISEMGHDLTRYGNDSVGAETQEKED